MILAPQIDEIRAGLDMQGSVWRRTKKFSIHDIGRRAVNLETRGAEAHDAFRHAPLFRTVKAGKQPQGNVWKGVGYGRRANGGAATAPERSRLEHQTVERRCQKKQATG